MLARKKTSPYIRHKFTLNWKILVFTFNDAEDYATSEKWQKIFTFFQITVTVVSVIVAQW
jgi:hypothetical protein